MSVSELSKKFLHVIEERVGPFDRPFQLRVFPFDAGGALNFLTVGTGRSDPFVTYVSWDLSGHEQQKHGSLGSTSCLPYATPRSGVLMSLPRLGARLCRRSSSLAIHWTSGSGSVRVRRFKALCSRKHCAGSYATSCDATVAACYAASGSRVQSWNLPCGTGQRFWSSA